ncbi:amidohydrolase family protein [Paeniglutamicibacter kerguelensis]|uniref:amidohydrolase family protein n=1 Tax=Paeniglutamicibacter kerguelensis TaxID=254788 RepID=UPI001AE31DA0|nr:amidohydrolase family protein [Paeniglutamicibacter kerguelensis]
MKRVPHMLVDVHTHFVPDFVVQILRAGSGAHGITGTTDFLETAAGRLPLHYPEMQSPSAKLSAMDERGVDISIVSLTPHLFIYGQEHDPIGFARRANDAIAEFIGDTDRLYGLATLPIGDAQAAAAELRRATEELGLVGAIIGTGLGPSEPLDVLGLGPLFEEAAELGAPLLVHPYYCGMVTSPELFLNNSLGVPFDTAWAVGRLMATGTLDRHPGLKLIVPHGGGALPYLLGRMENAWKQRPELREAAGKPPSGYAEQIWYDSIVHSETALRFLAAFAGADRVLLGTDSPYMTGDGDPAGSFAAAGLDPLQSTAAAVDLFKLGRMIRAAVP